MGGAETGDHFGLSVAAADFDNDGNADLAIGVPFEDFGGLINPGAVNVVYAGGRRSGDPGFTLFSESQFWTQNSSGIAGTAENFDMFGSTLAWGKFDAVRGRDLVIGVPGEDIGTRVNAGAVNVIYGSSGGLTAAGDQIWHQNRRGIAGSAESGDQFGGAIH